MKSKVFFRKFLSLYLWGNLMAMAVVVVLLCLGVKYGLEIYTHHGENIVVPDLKNMDYEKARQLLEQDGLRAVVSDSGYNKRLPANSVLAQNPGYGVKVKSGHTIYLTLNSPSSPAFALPDLVDNSSVREAEAKLRSMGFKLLEPRYVPGEKDWVYGILCRDRRVGVGDMVSIETPITLLVGSGMYEEEDVDVDYASPDNIVTDGGMGDVDEFEEVTAPPATDSGPATEEP